MTNFTMSKAFSHYIIDRSESVFKEKEMVVVSDEQQEVLLKIVKLSEEIGSDALKRLALSFDEVANKESMLAAITAYKLGLQDGYRMQKDQEDFLMGSYDHQKELEVEQ